MPLDDLVSVIETLQRRIREHGDTLRQNETRTRMALIDPLLTALGWDVANPAEVLAEWINGGPVEYMLLDKDGKTPLAMVVTRGLDDDPYPYRMQYLRTFEGSEDLYLVITDGNHWEMFDAIRPKTPSISKILNLCLSDHNAHSCALDALQIWHPKMTLSLLSWKTDQALEVPSDSGQSASGIRNQAAASVIPPIGDRWKNLSEISDPTSKPPPDYIQFPNGEQSPLKTWRDLLENTIAWLWSQSLLTNDNVPIMSGPKNYLLSIHPFHPSGNRFKPACRIQSTPFFIDGKISSKAVIAGTKKILKHCGQDPSKILIRMR